MIGQTELSHEVDAFFLVGFVLAKS